MNQTLESHEELPKHGIQFNDLNNRKILCDDKKLKVLMDSYQYIVKFNISIEYICCKVFKEFIFNSSLIIFRCVREKSIIISNN